MKPHLATADILEKRGLRERLASQITAAPLVASGRRSLSLAEVFAARMGLKLQSDDCEDKIQRSGFSRSSQPKYHVVTKLIPDKLIYFKTPGATKLTPVNTFVQWN